MGREFELKYRAATEILELLQETFQPLTPITMETVYYDAPDGSLSALRWTLRRRLENGVSVCTLKVPLPDGSRGEWEVHAPDVLSAVPLLIAIGAPETLSQLTASGVVPRCGARFTRLAKTIPLACATVELALDRGVLLGGGKESPFAEVEVELKAGSEEAATAYARQLADRYGLTPEPKSKLQRALALLT